MGWTSRGKLQYLKFSQLGNICLQACQSLLHDCYNQWLALRITGG